MTATSSVDLPEPKTPCTRTHGGAPATVAPLVAATPGSEPPPAPAPAPPNHAATRRRTSCCSALRRKRRAVSPKSCSRGNAAAAANEVCGAASASASHRASALGRSASGGVLGAAAGSSRKRRSGGELGCAGALGSESPPITLSWASTSPTLGPRSATTGCERTMPRGGEPSTSTSIVPSRDGPCQSARRKHTPSIAQLDATTHRSSMAKAEDASRGPERVRKIRRSPAPEPCPPPPPPLRAPPRLVASSSSLPSLSPRRLLRTHPSPPAAGPAPRRSAASP